MLPLHSSLFVGTVSLEVSLDSLLPWVAIAVGVLSVFGSSWGVKSTEDDGTPTAFPAAAALLAILLAYAAALLFRSQLRDGLEIAHGIAIGAIGTCLAARGDKGGQATAAALGVATAAAGLILLLPVEMRQSLWLGAASGAGAMLLLGGGRQGLSATWALGMFAGASVLSSYRDGIERAGSLPAIVGVFALIVLFAIRLMPMGKYVKWLGAGLLLVGAAALIAQRYLFLGAALNVAVGAVASAAIVAYILESHSREAIAPVAICAFIWLAWGTIAFGLLQGLGLAISALFAGAFLVCVGSSRGLAAATVLVALLFYRIFLEAFPTDSRAIEVSQHYAVMGIVAGCLLPTLMATWKGRICQRFDSGMRMVAAVITGLILVALIVAADFILGSRGTVGMLIGLCVAPVVSAMGGSQKIGATAAIGSLGATIVLLFGFVAPNLLIERELKIQILGWTIAAAILLIAIAAWLIREPGDASIHENAS
jgi:hypothetical protein